MFRLKSVFFLSLFAVSPLLQSSAEELPVAEQRPDSCVILEAGDVKAGEDRLHWKFHLRQPGIYTVQVVKPVVAHKSDLSMEIEVDGETIAGTLRKVAIIEDGLITELEEPLALSEAGVHTFSVDSNVMISKIRLVPHGYTKSRIQISSSKYYPEWLAMHESPEKKAAMEWYRNARFGMFIHWGVYSEAAGSWKGKKIEEGDGPSVAEWLMFAFKISREEYREYAKNFLPDKSFAENIVKLAKDTGMKYMVITAKHHDGFALFDSEASDFDITDATDYEGDLIKELYDACRAEGLEFGVYYSHGNDWGDGGDGNHANVKKVNDKYGVPTRPNGKNLWDPSSESHTEYFEKKAYPQIRELLELLPDLRLIWFDGDGLITEEQAFRFYKMIYEVNPNVIVSRRVGYDFGDYVDAGDNKTPAANELAAKHFETCGTGNDSWGFKAYDHEWKSPDALLRNFVDIVSKGGNYLLNIGPDGKGAVPEPCVENFQEMGKWVKMNSEAIFGTRRWTVFNENMNPEKGAESVPGEFWFSAKGDKIYAMSLAAPEGTSRILAMNAVAGKVTSVRLLGSDAALEWKQTEEALEIDFSGLEIGKHGFAVEVGWEERVQLDFDKPLKDLLDQSVLDVPQIHRVPEKDMGDIQAIFYDALDFEGKPTRVFAYLGIPESDEPVPGMVLVHGGGGRAFPEWVKLWNDRGYAAISMSLEGHMTGEDGDLKARHEFSGPERVGMFDDIEKPLDEQWMYHAVSDVMLANSLLRSLPEVDADRTGMTGISWGGVLSSLISGVDDRFKCVMPVYGAGFLYESKGRFKDMGAKTEKMLEKKKFWDPARQFSGASMPTLWTNGDVDGHFSVNITSRSFEETAAHSFITIHPGMPHGHGSGWHPERVPEVYAFADQILKSKGEGLGKIRKQPQGREIEVAYESSVPIAKATVHYLEEKITYRKKSENDEHTSLEPWLTMPAEVNGDEKTVTAKLPESAMTYYVNLTDERGYTISSLVEELEK
ncbi:MAG: alpha-L-fucosidase [Luteolibacter sp.]